MSVFSIRELNDVKRKVAEYKLALQTALYEQYKQAYSITKSINFKGEWATSYKQYVEAVNLNLINQILNATEELSSCIDHLAQSFAGVESSTTGIISDEALQDAEDTLTAKENQFNTWAGRIDGINARAKSEGIALVALSSPEVNTQFTKAQARVQKIGDEKAEANTAAQPAVEALNARIAELMNLISQLMKNYYTENGTLKFDELPSVKKAEWYHTDDNTDVLAGLRAMDPFYAGGVSTDNYTHNVGKNGGWSSTGAMNAYASGRLGSSFAEGQAGASLIDFHANGNNMNPFIGGDFSMQGLKGEVGGYVGENGAKGYAGAKLFSMGGGVTLAPGTVNLRGEAEVTFFSADAFAESTFEDVNNFSFGAGASADAAKIEGGLYAGEVTTSNGATTPLFGFSASGSAGVGGSLGMSSTNWIDGNIVDVNIATVDFGASLGLGFDLKVTFPYINLFGWLN